MKDMMWIKEGYFAHRGLHNDLIPENSLGAFKNAVVNGFDIELDIRLTNDERIVVIHDKNLKRLCGIDKLIKDTNYDEIKSCRLLDTDEEIPLLKTVMDSLPVDTQLLIELKPSKNSKLFVKKFLEFISKYSNKYAVHSFDPRIVYQFRKQKPDIIRGQIASTFPHKRDIFHKALKHLLYNPFTKPDFVNYRFEDLPRKKLDKLHKRGMIVLSYTAKNQEGLDFVKAKYDNAVFEGFIPRR